MEQAKYLKYCIMTPNILLTLFLLSSTFAELITPAIYYDIPGPIIRVRLDSSQLTRRRLLSSISSKAQ